MYEAGLVDSFFDKMIIFAVLAYKRNTMLRDEDKV